MLPETLYKTASVDLLVKRMTPLALEVEKDFSRGVAIYGAGFVGTWAVSYLQSIGATVTHFIDRDQKKTGTKIHGIPVILPTDPAAASTPSIFIAARHAVKSVQSAMAGQNYNLISFDGYYVVRNYHKFSFVRDNFFTDGKSVETYNAILTAMLTSSLDSCLSVMEKDMYFALPEFSGNFDEIFVDAGAFVGDTVERFFWENLGTFRHLYAFEPGSRQFQAMEQRISRLKSEWAIGEDYITAVRAGLADQNGRRMFSFVDDSPLRHGLTAEDLDKHNSDSIEVYALDSFLKGKPVTFIKADVEGMEMELLKGAQATISRFKPKLAICVYHYPSDLIEVAEFVRSLVPEYKFSLRLHAPIFGDFVLYCYC
ncbi:MAG: FkbM family methyltransferase [Candidatus Wallbacteria bacterium]|nr:FkbM family methyltransferase [Candidatus Wallbacteria bacterium]